MTLNTRATTLARSAVLNSMPDRAAEMQAVPDTPRTGKFPRHDAETHTPTGISGAAAPRPRTIPR